MYVVLWNTTTKNVIANHYWRFEFRANVVLPTERGETQIVILILQIYIKFGKFELGKNMISTKIWKKWYAVDEKKE